MSRRRPVWPLLLAGALLGIAAARTPLRRLVRRIAQRIIAAALSAMTEVFGSESAPADPL